MKTLKTVILADGFLRVDAPRWHAGSLWMSDTVAGKVYCVGLDGVSQIVADVREQPMGIGFLPDGSTLVSSMRDRRILRLDRSRHGVYADFGHIVSGYLRDLAVDREGYAFAASFDSSACASESYKTSRIILATPNGDARIVASNLAYPNGLALTGNHRLLVAETLSNRILAFEVGEEHDLLHKQIFVDFEQMSPIGICVDAEGAVWAAAAGLPLFVRVLEGGRITHRVHVPGRNAVAVQLGGSDGRTLFCLTTARNLRDYPGQHATARVEITSTDVPGFRLH